MLIQIVKISDNKDETKKDDKDETKTDNTTEPEFVLTAEEEKEIKDNFLTHKVQVSALRRGGYVMLQGHPCKIIDMTTAK